MAQPDANTNSSVLDSHALTDLHLAVLANDYHRVRKIVGDGEIGVDVPNATGTTALMLAALYGRSRIFFFLTGYNASPTMKDSYQYTAQHYAELRSPFLKGLIRDYSTTAFGEPEKVGRHLILRQLKARRHERNKSYHRGFAAGYAQAQAQAKAQTRQIQPQASVNMDNPNAQQPLQDPSVRLVFLRSLNGREQEVGEFRRIATAEHGHIGRKCTGFICAADVNDSHKFAVSGWGRAEDKNAVYRNVLDNKDYTELIIRVAALLDFELHSTCFDNRFPGSPSEKKGAFVACHSEKQLAVFVLIKAISHVFGTKSLTLHNITHLKNQLDKLPSGLRETTIHLDHKIVCSSCIQFLEHLTQKTGLIFRCVSQNWYTFGQRPQLRPLSNGSYQQVKEATRDSDLDHDADVIDDEIDVFDTDDTMEADVQKDAMEHEGDSLMVQGDSVTALTPSTRQPGLVRHQVLRIPSYYPKKGSPVDEEPTYDGTRYAVLHVTPPSKKAQELPTPQSHTRLTEVPRIAISPSPAGASSAFSPQADSMSPSMSQEYEVEEILQSKEENGVRLFLVKWNGYSQDSNTWEPEKNLCNASEAIRKFWEELHAARSGIQNLDS